MSILKIERVDYLILWPEYLGFGISEGHSVKKLCEREISIHRLIVCFHYLKVYYGIEKDKF